VQCEAPAVELMRTISGSDAVELAEGARIVLGDVEVEPGTLSSFYGSMKRPRRRSHERSRYRGNRMNGRLAEVWTGAATGRLWPLSA